MKQDVNKDLNVLLSFSVEVTPWTIKNNFEIILGSKANGFKNIEARKKLAFLSKMNVAQLR